MSAPRSRLYWVVAVVVLLVLGGLSGASFVTWKYDRDRDNRLRPFREMVQSFPVPLTASPTSDMDTTSPLRVIKGWEDSALIDPACRSWGDAFRTWLGPGGVISDIGGSYTQGSSCNFQAVRGEADTELMVAGYGTGKVQVLLTVTDRAPS
jgi:hypothetical protein